MKNNVITSTPDVLGHLHQNIGVSTILIKMFGATTGIYLSYHLQVKPDNNGNYSTSTELISNITGLSVDDQRDAIMTLMGERIYEGINSNGCPTNFYRINVQAIFDAVKHYIEKRKMGV